MGSAPCCASVWFCVQGLFLVTMGEDRDQVQPRKLLGVAASGVREAELPQLSKGELTVIERGVVFLNAAAVLIMTN